MLPNTDARVLVDASTGDDAAVFQVDDTRAQVFIAEKKFKEAESVARNAVRRGR